MVKYDYILFDLDGTLTDPALGITNSVIYALKKLGAPVESRDNYYRFIGPPLIDSFVNFCGFDEDKAREALKFYREYFTEKGIFENAVYDGIAALLRALNENGLSPVLATSKPEVFARQILEHFSLSEYFAFIGGADLEETRATKDAVIGYVLENICNPPPERCLMVGDRKYDVCGASAHGIETIGVSYGYGTEDELRAAGALAVVRDVAMLRRLLLG